MPPGSLYYDFEDDEWKPLKGIIGKEIDTPKFFAVPITKHEEVTLHEPITREAFNKALRERDEARAEARESLRDKFAMAALTGCYGGKAPQNVEIPDFEADAEMFYQIADAMLAARNNQPEIK